MHFFSASLVFLNMATLTKQRILRYESHFFVFRVFAFFSKNRRKNNPKLQIANCHPKITKSRSPGSRFGSQHGSELTSKKPKIPKMNQKSRFWTEQFFEYSLRPKDPLSHVSAKWDGIRAGLKIYRCM